MNVVKQYGIAGRSASALGASLETAVQEGRIPPGEALPTVRALAAALGVSPATVAAAYRTLRLRGLVSAAGRRGTRVHPRPPLRTHAPALVPSHLRNLADGNPDPALLPPLRTALSRLDRRPRLYGEASCAPPLLALAARELSADGIAADALTVVGGALDGIERVLQAHVRPGDRVAVEDPGYTGVLDLVSALGLVPVPVGVDDDGPLPGDLERVLATGVQAFILTPRAQNPTGAALDERRRRDLRRVLALRPDVLVVEDDHAGPVAGAAALSLCDGRTAWAVVRSVSKWLGPDLRLAVLAGDQTTVGRVEGRQRVASGWVSHILQSLVVDLWSAAAAAGRFEAAAALYRERRQALVQALADRGIEAHGRSGLNVWVPVPEEVGAVGALAAAGWAVRAGERYRLKSPPAVRITIATLAAREVRQVAAALVAALAPGGRTAPA
jgi:DNA-binding transcriptional MocR family regulator